MADHRSHGAGHHSRPFRRVLSLLWPDRRDLVVVLCYAVCVGILSLAVPITASAVVNTVALTTLVQQLIVLCIGLAVALGLASVLQLLQQVVVEYVQRRVFVRVAGELAGALPRVEYAEFDRQHGPELVNRFFDVLTVQKASATLLMDGVALGLQILIGLILLASYDSILLGFDAILLVGIGLIVFPLGRKGVETAVRESVAKYAVAGWLEEITRHPLAFKFFGGAALAHDRTDRLAHDYLAARAAHFRVMFRQVAFGLLMQVTASVALLGIGGVLVIRGNLTLGQLVAAQIVVNLVVSSFAKIGKQLESWYDLLAAADKIGHLLDLPREADGGTSRPALPGGVSLVARDVSFRYDVGTEPVFSGLSFAIAPGERVALLGASGSGKTTLLELLCGLRRPQSGWVELDDTDWRDWNPTSAREQIAVVQGVEIYDGTVADNVRMGREHLTLHDLRTALGAVGLWDDIAKLPAGLETRLTTGGSPLSQGQAERLVLARAVVGRPRLIVLDETLDSLDPVAGESILRTILDPAAAWTLLATTHRADVAARFQRQVSLPFLK